MKKKIRNNLHLAASMLTAFVLWTAIVCLIDVKKIGPQGSAVGLAAINEYVHHLTGVHMELYVITDWLSLVPLGVAAGFALLGLFQWIQRKQLRRVDFSILILGGFYLAVVALYGFFEMVVVNYRPVLIQGILEASYPSSTTMLVMCVMPTAAIQLKERIRNRSLKFCTLAWIAVFTGFMIICRFISGVHWFSDIVGGALLSIGLVKLYCAICGFKMSD